MGSVVRRSDGMIALTMHIMRNVVVELESMCGGVDVRTELVDRRVRLIILAGWVARMLNRNRPLIKLYTVNQSDTQK